MCERGASGIEPGPARLGCVEQWTLVKPYPSLHDTVDSAVLSRIKRLYIRRQRPPVLDDLRRDRRYSNHHTTTVESVFFLRHSSDAFAASPIISRICLSFIILYCTLPSVRRPPPCFLPCAPHPPGLSVQLHYC